MSCKFCEAPEHDPDVYDAPEEINAHIKHIQDRLGQLGVDLIDVLIKHNDIMDEADKLNTRLKDFLRLK